MVKHYAPETDSRIQDCVIVNKSVYVRLMPPAGWPAGHAAWYIAGSEDAFLSSVFPHNLISLVVRDGKVIYAREANE